MQGLKLNVGCGWHVDDGWVNIDLARHPRATRDPDIFADVRKIPLDDGCAGVIKAIHIFEHFYEWEVGDLLAEWNRLLQTGGRLVMEMPDVIKCAKNLLDNKEDQYCMWGFYGDPRPEEPLMCHKWGWSFHTVKPVLKRAGFRDIILAEPQHHRRAAKGMRDFRVEATKA